MTAEAVVMASNESREALAERLLEWERRARDAEGRADALAAHVERLHFAAKRAHGRMACASLALIRDGEAAYFALGEVLEQEPTTSLARRDALKQAEVLEKLSRGLLRNSGAYVLITLEVEATKLRRQAEGGGS